MTLIDDAAMEARCRAILADLDLPPLCTPETLVASIAAQQGRPITLLPLPREVGGDASGMVRHTDEGYQIYYPHDADPWWVMACVSHEIGHIVCGHVRDPLTAGQEAQGAPRPLLGHGIEGVLPSLAGAFGEWGDLWRCQGQGPQEQEAEFLGSLLVQRTHPSAAASVVSVVLSPPPSQSAPASPNFLQRWSRSLRRRPRA